MRKGTHHTPETIAKMRTAHLGYEGPRRPRHGTPGEYTKQACRCDACRKAWADYNRLRMQARRG